MTKWMLRRALVSSAAIVGMALTVPASAASLKVISDTTVTGFKFPESVAYDPNADAL